MRTKKFWLVIPLCHSLFANEIIITSDTDSGTGSLRSALFTLQEGDILQFDLSLTDTTIVLTSSLPQINTACTILGPPNGNITIDGQQQFSIFHLNGEVTIQGIDLKNPSQSVDGSALFIDENARVGLEQMKLILTNNANPDTHPILLKQTGYLRMADVDFVIGDQAIAKHILLEDDSALILHAKMTPKAFVEGNGNIYKTGAGNVALTTIDSSSTSHHIAIAIEEGTLVFAGETEEPIVVLPGATLKGNHSSLYIANAGTVKPGQSIGVNLTQNYFQMKEGLLQIEFNSSGAIDQILVSQDATLAGNLELLPTLGAYYKGDSLTFLTTGGTVNGTFDSTFSSAAGLAYQIQYNPASVQINFLQNLISFDGNPLSNNPAIVLQVLENLLIPEGADMRDVIASLSVLPNASSLYQAIDQLHPAPYAGLGWAAATTLHQMGTALTRSHLAFCATRCEGTGCCSENKTQRVWVSGVGEFQHQNTMDRLLGFHANTGGVLLGYDYAVQKAGTIGLSAGYTYTDLFWQHSRGKVTTNGFYGATYGSFCVRKVLIEAFCIGNYNRYDVQRKIDFPGLTRTAKSTPHAFDVMGHLGFKLPYIVSPVASVEYTYFQRSSLSEHGAESLNLHVTNSSMQFVRAEAGVWYQQRFCYEWGAIVPNVGLSYLYYTPVTNAHLTAHFAGFSEPFTVSTTDHAINAIAPTATLSVIAGKNVSVSATYAGQFGTKWRDQTVNLNLAWQF